MKKSKILVPALAVLALGMAGAATSTVAWYTANANAKVNATAASGNLQTTESSISAGEYTVNFTVTPASESLELSHVVSEAGTDGAGTALAVGDLIYGVISNGTATTRKCATSSAFICSYSISASWEDTPSDPADVAYLKGKKFTINLGVSGQAKLLATNGVTGLVNATAATAVVTIGNDLSLSVGSYTHAYVHIEPASLTESETGTTGAVTVAAASNVSLS